MIIGISGKIGSGKDLAGQIIQALTDKPDSFDYLDDYRTDEVKYKVWDAPTFVTKKFADKLKDMVCLLLNCTREQLEDREFKEKELGEEWWYYTNTLFFNEDTKLVPYMDASKKIQDDTSWYIIKLTPRRVFQLLGTECGRQIIHPNIWVNTLMSEYKKEYLNTPTFSFVSNTRLYSMPNWIITDVRFPNELKTIKDKGGITIRINRESELYYKYSDIEVEQKLISMGYEYSDNDNFDEDAINEGFKWSEKLQRWSFDEDIIVEHFSETALDNAEFDYTIDNDGTIKELAMKLKEILIKEKLIK